MPIAPRQQNSSNPHIPTNRHDDDSDTRQKKNGLLPRSPAAGPGKQRPGLLGGQQRPFLVHRLPRQRPPPQPRRAARAVAALRPRRRARPPRARKAPAAPADGLPALRRPRGRRLPRPSPGPAVAAVGVAAPAAAAGQGGGAEGKSGGGGGIRPPPPRRPRAGRPPAVPYGVRLHAPDGVRGGEDGGHGRQRRADGRLGPLRAGLRDRGRHARTGYRALRPLGWEDYRREGGGQRGGHLCRPRAARCVFFCACVHNASYLSIYTAR